MPSNSKFHLIIPFIALLILFSCKKQDAIKPGGKTPQNIVTVKDSLMDGGGVRLFGQLILNDQITDYGFEYGTDTSISVPIKLSLGTNTKANFSADIIDGLVFGTKYYFRAYEILNGKKITGDILVFRSAGGIPIIVTSIQPAAACMLDTLTLHGKHFDPKKTGVYFGNTPSKIVSISDSVIVCVIPNMNEPFYNSFVVRDDDNLRSAYEKFNFPAPVITSFTNQKSAGDTVEIDGNNFDQAVNYMTEVDFGIAKGQIVSTSKTKIRVIVPTFYYGSVSIKVVSQQQSVTSATPFSIAPPQITGVPASATILSLITITGKHFSPIYNYDYDQVFVNGVKADIYGGDVNSISIRVPDIPYPNRTATISVSVFGQTATYNGTISVTDKFVMAANGIPFVAPLGYSAFVAGGQAYCLGIPNGNGTGGAYVYKFNPANYTWTQGPVLPGLNASSSSLVCNGSRVFIYSYGADHTGKFWEYIPATQQLIARAAFPGEVRTQTTMFYIGNTVYLGFGWNTHGYQDFYAYDTQADTWKKVSGVTANDFGGQTLSYFTIGNNGYIIYQSAGGVCSVWQYNAASDTWTQKSSLPLVTFMCTNFVTNGYGYLFANSLYYKYDPVADAWTKGTSVGSNTFAAIITTPEFGFTLGSKSYFGLTDSNSQSTYLYFANNAGL
ncbi:MAG TPA: IPT/TIG domain-containing protein [Mucilaginibacter sp.]|jgi:hypothetical protein|nr:IPT/TIG domain-containing protein [Mucilaginibacter sp.]